MNRFVFILFFIPFSFMLSAQEDSDLLKEFTERMQIKDYHRAIEVMDIFIENNPTKHHGYYNRAIAKLSLGDRPGACEDFLTAKKHGNRKNKKLIDFTCDTVYRLEFLNEKFYEGVTLYPELGYRPKYTRKDSLRGALRPERNCFDVTFYDLNIKILIKDKSIEGSNKIYFKVLNTTNRIQIDLFDRYKIDSITWNGKDLKYTREFNAIFIDFPSNLNKGSAEIIEISYSGTPQEAKNPPWQGGFVWDKKRGKHWIGVACEHLGASSWWPNKDHLSDEPDSAQISITVPSKYFVVANGTLKNVHSIDNKYKKFQWFISYPINNYNITFYLGNYVNFNEELILNEDTLQLKYYVLPHNLEKAKSHFSQTKEVLRYYNATFGKYPFMRDGFGLVESPYEGMEHQTAIAFGNEYDKGDDNVYNNDRYDYIIVHEAAHEWWGNAISIGDMADIWLHEGFATYAELIFLENKFGHTEYLKELIKKRGYIFNFWPLIQNRDVNENAFASSDCYMKGAMILHNIRCIYNNDSIFFKMIKDFYEEKVYKIINTDNFINHANKYSENDLTSFFKKYLYDTKIPVLAYNFNVHPDGKLTLKYRWTEVEEGFEMPFAIRTDRGKSVRLTATTKEQTFELKNSYWISFFNEMTGTKDMDKNSLTYFWTRWERE